MKPIDPLDRLFRAAARTRRTLPSEAPVALEQRVMASWRRGDGARIEWMDFLPLFRRSLAFACVVFVLALAWSYHGLSNNHSGSSSDSEAFSLLDASAAYSYYP